MINFFITDKEGKLLRHGHCSEETLQQQVFEGEVLHTGLPPQQELAAWYDEGHYKNRRVKQYLPVGEQLDAIYKLAAGLVESGVAVDPAVTAWVEHCKQVKLGNPKP